jgi:hypothetical protein
MGYRLRKVLKAKPKTKIPETDAIFEQMTEVDGLARQVENIVCLSIDAKNGVDIGEFSRGGKSRIQKKACDHDFGRESVTPFGILNVKDGDVSIYLIKGSVTADCIVDRLEQYWISSGYAQTKPPLLIIKMDNGPECNSRRTQFMKRILEFSRTHEQRILLAYYPPYHSKYNPVERVWGILEQHWNGDILDTLEAVCGFCASMTWKKEHPEVTLVEEHYQTGVKLTAKQMGIVETALDRFEHVGRWFINICPKKSEEILGQLC